MLRNTFCHIPGISAEREKRLWAAGIYDWHHLSHAQTEGLPRKASACLSRCIEDSFEHLERRNPNYFAERLASNQHWRLAADFRRNIAYLDIETTGLGYHDSITTIAIYDGERILHYVQGQNLNDFKRDIQAYNILVTYNGKSFDAPFIERFFNIKLRHAHIDLRYVLKSLGYTGGLKSCERRLGIDRKDLADIDGFFAVLLWQDYKRNRNENALQTLLAYNVQDVIGLETLLVIAYNSKLKETPFASSHALVSPAPPDLPFHAHRETIDRIKRQNTWFGGDYKSRRW